MFERAYLLTVKDGCYEEYKKAHDELWPEMQQQLNDNQLHMVIFYFEPYLLVYQVAPSKDHFTASDNSEINLKWNEFMKEVLATDESGDFVRGSVEDSFRWGFFKESDWMPRATTN